MEYICVKEELGFWNTLNHLHHSWHRYMVNTNPDHIYQLNSQVNPKLHMQITQWVFTSHENFQINPCTKIMEEFTV